MVLPSLSRMTYFSSYLGSVKYSCHFSHSGSSLRIFSFLVLFYILHYNVYFQICFSLLNMSFRITRIADLKKIILLCFNSPLVFFP
jgi:hypothetical protein